MASAALAVVAQGLHLAAGVVLRRPVYSAAAAGVAAPHEGLAREHRVVLDGRVDDALAVEEDDGGVVPADDLDGLHFQPFVWVWLRRS